MSDFKIIDEQMIDPDLGVKIILRSDSPNWKIQFNLPGKGQQRHSLKTKSKKQAKLRAYKLAGQLATGSFTDDTGKKFTIGEVLDKRCERLHDLGRSPQTIADFHRRIRQLGAFLPQGLKTPISKLTLPTLEAFERKLGTQGIDTPPAPGSKGNKVHKGKPQKPKTVRDAMKSVRSLMKFARDRGWLLFDPAAGYEFPPKDVTPIIVFSPKELALLFEDKEDGVGSIWRLYCETCLRAQELTWLMKDDVVVDEKLGPVAILIREKTCPQTRKSWKPKHGKNRTVPLTRTASAILAEAMAASQTRWAFRSPIPNERQPGKWTDGQLRRRLQRRLKAVGIAKCGLHRFGHTGATYLANDPRMSVVQLQKFLGHSDLKQTQRYLHPRPEHIADAIRKVDFDKLIDLDKTEDDNSDNTDVGNDANNKEK